MKKLFVGALAVSAGDASLQGSRDNDGAATAMAITAARKQELRA